MQDLGGCSQEPSSSTYPRKAVPRPSWEVAADFGLSCLQHWRDEQPPTPQELAVHGPGVGVFGEPGEGQRAAVQSQSIAPLPPPPQHSLEEERPCHRLSSSMSPVEEGVEVGQEGVAEAEGFPHGILGGRAEGVRLLWLQGRRRSGMLRQDAQGMVSECLAP